MQAATNSAQFTGRLTATGSTAVALNDLVLEASNLPFNTFGFFITSRGQSVSSNPGGSQGDLCLPGSIGRFIGAGQVGFSNLTGRFSLIVDLTAIPNGVGIGAVQAGETWYFQAWHRDANPLLTSNFTDAIEILFR